MSDKRKMTRKCVACGNEIEVGKRVIRGCHERCYRAALRHAERAGHNLSVLVNAGLVLEANRSGRPKGSPNKLTWPAKVRSKVRGGKS